jgi:hypothetical protein
MQLMRKATLAAGMIGVVAQIGVAQGAAPAAAHTAAQQPISIDSAYKKLGMHAYPAKGQSAEQQKADTHECYAWAKGQTGFDPATAVAVDPAAAAASAEQQVADATAGAAVVGGAKGAAGGALIGAAAGDAGKGAAIGAATGAVVGRSRKKRAEKQAGANAAQAAATQPNPQVDSFKKAIGACLQGRGYTFSK